MPAEQRTGTIKQIWVVCHSHLDIGFTRPPDEVARDYKDNIDTAIRLARENADFRWTIESTWMLEQWLARTEDQALIEELGRLMRAGRVTLGGAFANMHSGLMAPEESNRLAYLAEKFRRRFGIRAEVAFQNDVPGFTWAYPRILAASGMVVAPQSGDPSITWVDWNGTNLTCAAVSSPGSPMIPTSRGIAGTCEVALRSKNWKGRCRVGSPGWSATAINMTPTS